MAYSLLGTYTGSVTNIYGTVLNNYSFKVDVYIEQNINANTSSLKFIPTISCSGGTGTASTFYFSVMDSTDYHRSYIKLGHTVYTYSAPEIIKTYSHNVDGTKSLTISVKVENEHSEGANGNLNNYCMKRASISASVTLPTIPRTSTFTVSGNKIGSPINLTISRLVSTFTHQVWYKFGNINCELASGVGTSYSFTPSPTDANQIPNSTSGTCTLTVKTYNGSVYVGEKSVSFNLYVADSMYPSFTGLSLSGSNLLNGLYIAGRSTVTAKIEGAVGSFSSTIKSYNITGSGLNTESASGTSSALIEGTHSYVGKITDSRGRSHSKSNSITVYTYVSPRIEGVVLGRCDSLGTFVDSGTYAKIDFNAIVQNTGNANKNAKSYKVEYRVKGVKNWTTWVSSTTLSSYTQAISIGAKSGFAVTNTYEIQITVTDSLSSVVFVGEIGTERVSLDIEEGGIGVGKYHERGGLDVEGEIYSNGHKVPVIKREDGVMEVGQYIDLHHGNFDNDFDVRFEVTNTRCLEIIPMGEWATVRGKLAINGNTGYNLDLLTQSDGVAIGNSGIGKYLRIANNGWLYYNGDIAINKLGILDSRGSNPLPNHYAGYQMGLDFKTANDLGMNDTASATWCNVLTTKGWSSDAAAHPVSQLAFNGDALYYRSSNGGNAWRGWCRIPMLHYVNGYWGFGIANNNTASWLRSPTSGFIPYESGGNSSSLGTQSWLWKEIHGKYIYMANGRCIWGSSANDIMVNSAILPETNGTRWLGWSNNKWAGVYASNGYIQTSDMRYKSDIKDIDDEIFFNMIKNTGVHSYVLNANRVDLEDEIMPLTRDEADQEDIQIGIIAQELAQYEGSEYVLNYDDEVGYTVNNYNLISAVMAALKVEISKREQLEERVNTLEQRIAEMEQVWKNMQKE